MYQRAKKINAQKIEATKKKKERDDAHVDPECTFKPVLMKKKNIPLSIKRRPLHEPIKKNNNNMTRRKELSIKRTIEDEKNIKSQQRKLLIHHASPGKKSSPGENVSHKKTVVPRRRRRKREYEVDKVNEVDKDGDNNGVDVQKDIMKRSKDYRKQVNTNVQDELHFSSDTKEGTKDDTWDTWHDDDGDDGGDQERMMKEEEAEEDDDDDDDNNSVIGSDSLFVRLDGSDKMNRDRENDTTTKSNRIKKERQLHRAHQRQYQSIPQKGGVESRSKRVEERARLKGTKEKKKKRGGLGGLEGGLEGGGGGKMTTSSRSLVSPTPTRLLEGFSFPTQCMLREFARVEAFDKVSPVDLLPLRALNDDSQSQVLGSLWERLYAREPEDKKWFARGFLFWINWPKSININLRKKRSYF